MHRRSLLVAALTPLVGHRAMAVGSDAVQLLLPEARAAWLHRFAPAVGPLARWSSRPGAWYALLFLPMEAGWPMQLRLWPVPPNQELNLVALDAAPDQAPGIAHRVPAEPGIGRNDTRARTARMVLPADSQAPGVFMLVEHWRLDGEPPEPHWAQWRSQLALRQETAPWWSARPAPGELDRPPPGVLGTPRHAASADRTHELPILALRRPLDIGAWR
jgi:hypothetical protein